jgi:hypothetical protein
LFDYFAASLSVMLLPESSVTGAAGPITVVGAGTLTGVVINMPEVAVVVTMDDRVTHEPEPAPQLAYAAWLRTSVETKVARVIRVKDFIMLFLLLIF